jgi:hypothetical protein
VSIEDEPEAGPVVRHEHAPLARRRARADRRAVELHVPGRLERGDELVEDAARQAARALRAEEALDLEVELARGDGRAARARAARLARERPAEGLLTGARLRDALEREAPGLAPEPVGEPRLDLPDQALALRDRRGRDVGARVVARSAVALPLLVVRIEDDAGRDDPARLDDPEHRLAGSAGLASADGAAPRELAAARPDRTGAGVADRLEDSQARASERGGKLASLRIPRGHRHGDSAGPAGPPPSRLCRLWCLGCPRKKRNPPLRVSRSDT